MTLNYSKKIFFSGNYTCIIIENRMKKKYGANRSIEWCFTPLSTVFQIGQIDPLLGRIDWGQKDPGPRCN